MTALQRAFVAVVPPGDTLDAIEARIAPRRGADARLRWMRREQCHLTVRFLGGVADVESLVSSLAAAVEEVDAFDGVQLGRAGAFPQARRGSVLWIGVVKGAEPLGALAAVVESAVVAVGSEPEPRAFHPHLTVARAPRVRDLRPDIDAFGDDPIGPPFRVDNVLLMSSDTRPDGAVYQELARFSLSS